MPLTRALGYDAAIGDGASEVIVVTHNLGSLSVGVSLRDVTLGSQKRVNWEATSINTITLRFSRAPAIGAMRVTVWRV
jgi:hypothetical protein